MANAELFESQFMILPGSSADQVQAQTEAQYREVGRMVTNLLRESPALVISIGVSKENAEHLEPDPRKKPPEVQRMTLKVVRLDDFDKATADDLWRIINGLQRRLAKLEGQSVTA